jgi:putative ABC transport system permease protein
MWALARKILIHERIKFAVAAAGVSISVLLVLVQVGLYYGFMENASSLIDHSSADIWVTGEGNTNFDFAAPIDERSFYRVLGIEGVEHAERLIVGFGQFQLAGGGNQGAEIVGLERNARLFSPWNVVEGDPERIADSDGIIVDRSEFAKLELERLGERREISGVRAKLVATTDGIRSFTTSPFVFTNIDNARAYSRLNADQITYVLVKAAPGVDLDLLEARIDALPRIEAYRAPAFSAFTRHYWSSRTGVGAGFFTTAVMGVIVGLVVVGQILYNGTLEHLKEYGTLKAMGAENGAIIRVILYQALISAAVGYVAGTALSFLSREAMRAANLTLVLSSELLIATAISTVLMCTFAAMLSIIKVLRLDPAVVFKA